ncbi:MAG TPA: paraquat-inducible protein A, partial [Verrucomicrobiae bacterium]|nr:paraquat-inducible protein A [Verrucomicrobiae bacterium]
LRFHRVPRGVTLILRLLQGIKPWGMVEVLMLGILVALVKLTQDFIVIPGVALWSFGGLTVMLAAMAASFNARDVWMHVERDSRRGAA